MPALVSGLEDHATVRAHDLMDMAIVLHDGLCGPTRHRSAMSILHDTTRPPHEHRGHDGGSRRVFEQFAWLEAGSGKVTFSRPAHQRVTPAVDCNNMCYTSKPSKIAKFSHIFDDFCLEKV